MTRPKHDSKTRKKIRSEIKKLHGTLQHGAIADRLNEMGFRRPDGRVCDQGFVSAHCQAMGLKGHVKRGPVPAANKPTVTPEANTLYAFDELFKAFKDAPMGFAEKLTILGALLK